MIATLVPLAVACDGALASEADAGRARDAQTEDASRRDAGPPIDAGPPVDGGPRPDAGRPPADATVQVRLVPASGVSGAQRVIFGVPLPARMLDDAARVRVRDASGAEIAAATRALATHRDGSLRSVEVQIDRTISGEETISVDIGTAGSGGLARVEVASTLTPASGVEGPRVWALLPAEWLSASGVAGPMAAASTLAPSLRAWDSLCDYERASFGTETFLSMSSNRAVWLYDRGTVFYRGYVSRGTLGPLSSAYRETALYRDGITGEGSSTRIGIPGGADGDPKYNYVQNLALHYLLSGDDRAREAAEDVATRMMALWPSPGYAGGADSWTERNAGFALLAYVWALRVTDEPALAATYQSAADTAVDAYLDLQATYPVGYADPDARCFAHHGDAHDPAEGNPYFGCSPWMSAILAEALDAYLEHTTPERAARVSRSLAQLARIIARDGVDPGTGRPYYWMGVGTSMDAPDDFDEHRGEAAYVVALGWHHDGRTDAALRARADELVSAFATSGEVGQLRSFNWQCRGAVMTPALLR